MQRLADIKEKMLMQLLTYFRDDSDMKAFKAKVE
jgi:hypothetical protein